MIEDADAANAYLHFVHALCEMAWPGANINRGMAHCYDIPNVSITFRHIFSKT